VNIYSRIRISLQIAFFMLVVAALNVACTNTDSGSDQGKAKYLGNWSGVANDSYICESGADAISIDLSETKASVSVNNSVMDGNASITKVNDSTYKLSVVDSNNVRLDGMVYFDPGFHYALLLLQTNFGGNSGYIGILQKNAPSGAIVYQDTDTIGDWGGSTIVVDNAFNTTSTSLSAVSISSTDGGLLLQGKDGEGDFSAPAPGITTSSNGSAMFVSGTYGIITTSMVSWPSPYGSRFGVYAMSADKKAVAAGLISDDCHYTLFADLANQKFALWTKP